MGCFDRGRPCFVQNAEVLLFRLRNPFRKVDAQFMAAFAQQLPATDCRYTVQQSAFQTISHFLVAAGHSVKVEKNDARIVEFIVKKV